jgi:vacuolar-type H+-ATPase subunit H
MRVAERIQQHLQGHFNPLGFLFLNLEGDLRVYQYLLIQLNGRPGFPRRHPALLAKLRHRTNNSGWHQFNHRRCVMPMEKTLQRLLDAEMRAEQIHQKAAEARDRMLEEARREARAEEERFEARLPELHNSFLEKANQRAEQTIAELKRRYDERHAQLRKYAESREDEALDAAFDLLIDPDADT